MIGDKVNIETDGEKGSIIEIMPRKSSLIRPPVANVDTMMLVVAAGVTGAEFVFDRQNAYKCGN